MLNVPQPTRRCRTMKSSQEGMMLFMAMIVLVAIMIGTVALFRTVDSGSIMAGNIAMQKAATLAADRGSEQANLWLTTNAGSTLFVDGNGYVANGLNDVPGTNQTWQEWWEAYSAAHPPVALATDSNGNTASYIIQRLCEASGNPKDVTCSVPPDTDSEGNNQSTDALELERATAVYYRITTRVLGPRNTVSFTQAIVSL